MTRPDKSDPFVKYSKDIALAAGQPFITSASLAESLGVSEVAARAHLRALVSSGLLSPLAYHPLGGRGRRIERYKLTNAVRFAVIDRRRGGEVYICTPPDREISRTVAKIFVTRPESDREKVLREEILDGIGKPFALTVLGGVSGVLVPAYHIFQLTAFHGGAEAAVFLTARIIAEGGTVKK